MAKEKFDKIQTPEFRVSFPAVFTPKAASEGGKEKYSIVMLFKKGTDITGIKDLLKRTILKKWPEGTPDNFTNPLKDGDEKEYAGYEGHIYCTASNQNTQPGLLDERKQPIIDPKEFYGGCYAIATVSAYAWSYMGKNGVSLGLCNLMKKNDGEPFGGGHSPEADFDNIALPDDTPTMDLGGDSIDDLGL